MLATVESWRKTLWIMFAAQLLAAVGFSTVFPFLPLYVEHLGVASGVGGVAFWVGMVFSAQAVAMTIASPFWGTLADRYGRKPMVERAMFGGAVIVALMAFATSAEMLTVMRAIQGLITGVVSAANALVAATAPRERTGYAMGLLQVGLWSGVAVGPLMGGLLADFVGFEAAFFVTAALLFGGGLLVHFGVAEPFVRPKAKGRVRFRRGWQRVMSAPGVAPVFLIRFMAWLARNLIVPFAPLFMAAILVDSALAGTATGLMIAVASGAGTLSAVMLGRLGDRIGHRRILVVCSLVAAAFYLPQAFVTAAWQLIALQAMTGAAIGGIMPALSALLNHYTDPGEEGAVYGLDNAIVSASRAVAPLIGAAIVMAAGALFSHAGDEADLYGYRATFFLAGLMFIVTAAVASWRLPEAQREAVRPAPTD